MGMDRDSHPSRIKENTYTFAKNISLEDSSGNGNPVVQNEPSNLLCQDFGGAFNSIGGISEYKVVGARYNTTMGRTYMFFVNTAKDSEFYKTSVIGYIGKHVVDFVSEDYDQECNCVNLKILDDPLEGQQQKNLCDFKIIVQDSCNKCLNFSLDNPIHERNIRFKNEQCGRRMYWTDRVNPPRYIDLDLIENPNWEENIYHHTGHIVCGNPIDYTPICFDCDKIKMIPDYEIPCLIPTNINLGGNLKLGTYEFLIAYCDEEGNELSNYFSHTNPVNLFDYNDVQMNQTELDKATSYAIELKASNLDEDFHYYKVAVIQHTEVNGEESYFIEGMHPITDKTILYTSERNKQRTTLNNILRRRVKIETVEQMIDSNGYLFMAGIRNKPVLNLQPIVNLMGPYFKWSSVIAKQNFYKNGVNASTNRSYMRDETYPLSLSFGMADGHETNDFILIGRGPQSFWEKGRYYRDLDNIADKYLDENESVLNPNFTMSDLNVQSIKSGKNACGGNERKYRWQYYNTSKLMGESSLIPRCLTPEEKDEYINNLIGLNTYSKDSIRTCSIFELYSSTGVELNVREGFTIKIGGDYRTNISLLDYVINNEDNYVTPGHPYYSTDLAYLLDEANFLPYTCTTTNSCNCLDKELLDERMHLYELDLSNPVHTYKPFITYVPLPYIESQFPNDLREEDYRLTGKYIRPGYPIAIHSRPKRNYGNNCLNAVPIKILEEVVIQEEEGYIIPVVGTRANAWESKVTFMNYNSTPQYNENYALSTFFVTGGPVERIGNTSCRTSPDERWRILRGVTFFPPKVAANALWMETQDIQQFSHLQISTMTTAEDEWNDNENELVSNAVLTKEMDVAYNRLQRIRVSFFEMCSNGTSVETPIKVLFLNSTQNHLLNLQQELGLTQGQFKIAIDTPLINLRDYEVKFNRYIHQYSTGGYYGDTIAEWARIHTIEYVYSPSLGYVTSFYRHWNVNRFGLAGKPIGDGEGCSHTNSDTAFREVTGYPSAHRVLIDDKTYITSSTDYSIMVLQRGREIDYTTYDVDNARSYKEQEYKRTCYYEDLDEKICEGSPFEEGMFSYVESVETYPDNVELYNSARLGITEEMFDSVVDRYKNNPELEWEDRVYSGDSKTVKDVFVDNFGVRSNFFPFNQIEFIDNLKTDFTCKPIRHFKFPHNETSPFLYTNENLEFQDTFIFPLGVTIDKTIVNIFLDIAVETGLMTQQQRDEIVYFKIKRGDRTIEKTIVSKGLLTDVIRYKDIDGSRYFPNFPYNSMYRKELLSRDGYSINHPFLGRYNNKFVFNSPEVDFGMVSDPTEITVDGFQYGDEEGQVNKVEDHAKMVLLTQLAINTADRMASTESTFEVLSQIAELGIGAAQAASGGGFSGFSGIAAGGVAAGFVATVVALRAPMISDRTAELRNKWIDIFKKQGIGNNFAHYIASVGNYNNYSSNTLENSRVRRVKKAVTLKEGVYNIHEPVTTDSGDDSGYMKVNNIDREKSLFLFLGPSSRVDSLYYTKEFSSIDTSNTEPNVSFIKETFGNRVANLYASIKVWKPDQYGEIGNIKWIDVTGCHFLTEPGPASFFGGDTFISKYAYKRKFNFFLVSSLNQADFTPFKYSHYFNIGRPKYFIDYETEHAKYGKSIITTPSSDWNLTQQNYEERGNYVTDGWFYHYQYGIPYFFVESTINCWNRYAGTEPWENFYPNVGDYIEWTQEKLVSIRRPNVLRYNYAYSLSGMAKSNNLLPNNFVSKFYNCTNNSPNGVMYSAQDVSEKQKMDPWLIYRNFDFYNFPTSNGKLIDLVNIESTQILGLFENQVSLFNAIDTLKERVSPETKELGTGGIFAQRPIDFSRTELGYGGTQHKVSVSNEFGHFWLDARRGQVFQVNPNGQGLVEITQGMRNWFKEHLPFKVLKGKIDGLSDLDVDNPFKNIGITMGWDSRYKRVFITKLDYIVKPKFIGMLEFVFRDDYSEAEVDLAFLSVNQYIRIKTPESLSGDFEIDPEVLARAGEEVSFDDTTVFEPVHFTVAYSPIYKTWISYYDFTPSFYINFDNYFSTGYNTIQGPSVWAHLLTNKSYGVFQGQKYPWKIEIPNRVQYTQKMMTNVEYWLDTIRYHNQYDYAINTKIGFDKATVYNNTDSSGYLNLVTKELNNRFQNTQYPKVTPTGTDILATYDEGKWSFNDFYNRAANINGNIPLWNYDKNAIDKIANPNALNYTNRWLDRIRGDWFLVRLEGGSDSRFKQIFKWVVPKDSIVI